jgi:patatin-like phospholipase/acyl hydrolase
MWWGIIPLINYFINNLKDPQVLKESLDNAGFITENYSIQDIVSEDLLITAWAINDRTPRWFTKYSQIHWTEKKFNHNMSLNNMVLTSAATPYYFKPVMIDGHDSPFISGDNVAQSPAMYAYYYATQKKNIP